MVSDDRVARVRDMFRDAIAVKERVAADHAGAIVEIADAIVRSIAGGGKVLLCGNGGSAADAQHLAAELLVRLRPHVNRQSIPALALAMDTSSITACGNDYSFEAYFERMVQSLGQKGDVLVAITTSGRSPNIIRALRAARAKGLVTIGLLGGNGGAALAECGIALVVPSTVTARIQEAHITIGHAAMELVEDALIAGEHISELPSP